MRIARSEAHRPEDAREKRDVVVFHAPVRQLVPLAQLPHHVEAKDVGLAFLQRAVALLERVAHRAAAVDRVLDAESVRHFVKHYVLEKRVERHVLHLVLGDQLARDRHHDAIELETHGVLEL